MRKDTVVINGATAFDEIFCCEYYGCFNIRKIIADIPRHPERFANEWLRIDEALIEYARQNVHIDAKRLVTATIERIDQPIIGLRDPDGSMFVIDGWHRIAARHQRKLEECEVRVLEHRFAEHYRVTMVEHSNQSQRIIPAAEWLRRPK